MILAAHYIGSGKDVVLCVEQLNSENCVIANETVIFIYYSTVPLFKFVKISLLALLTTNLQHLISQLTQTAIKDYNRARAYITDLAERRNVLVFDSPQGAVNCVISKLAPSEVKTELSSR